MAVFHLGLSTSGHDPAIAIVGPDGSILFAEATERVLQDKRAWGAQPEHLGHVEYALEVAGFGKERDTLRVATSWRRSNLTMAHDQRHKHTDDPECTRLAGSEVFSAAGVAWLPEMHASLQQTNGVSLLRMGLTDTMPEVRRFDHHLCHAVAACSFTPIQNASCVVMDGTGEVGALSTYAFQDRELSFRGRSWGPGSLGGLYAWITELCGFSWPAGEEWKVMGLAAYGTVRPHLRDAIVSILRVDNGQLETASRDVVKSAIAALSPYIRHPNDPIMNAADLAASGQAAYSMLADQVLDALDANEGEGNLILTGGCALNSSYNGTIAGRLSFDQVFVPPAPGDDGNAVGAAILSWMKETGVKKTPQHDGSPFLGSQPNLQNLEGILKSRLGSHFTDVSGNAADAVAQRLAAGKIIGVMRGRAEWGPRALGNRSILADPSVAGMKDRINLEVKGREPYRPFAPVIRAEDVQDWFDRPQSSPYMSLTLPWRSQKTDSVEATVHEDGTGRLQTVTKKNCEWMHEVLGAMSKKTGVPIILNTSFNVMGKPIVHTVEDAIAVFATSGLDSVLLDNVLLDKKL